MRGTRTRSLIASVTCIAFTTLVVWPRVGRAEGDKPAEAKPAPTAQPASPTDDAAMGQAKQHFETGRNAYNAGDYVTAIREFKAAEALRPSPILDYNIGLANEKLGKRRVAVKYYHRYLDEQPNAANKAEVAQKITALEAEIAAQPPPASTAQPGGTAPQPTSPGQEQAGDMPPPDTNATAAAQPGYDPYASQPPPGQPATAKPAKKKSLWWIWLIIAGAVTITVVVVVAVYLAYATTTTVYPYNHALEFAPAPRVDTSPKPLTLFRF
jgi:tetratricopeptide (TPR) repeat protein